MFSFNLTQYTIEIGPFTRWGVNYKCSYQILVGQVQYLRPTYLDRLDATLRNF